MILCCQGKTNLSGTFDSESGDYKADGNGGFARFYGTMLGPLRAVPYKWGQLVFNFPERAEVLILVGTVVLRNFITVRYYPHPSNRFTIAQKKRRKKNANE